MKITLAVSDMECPTCVKFLETLPVRLAGVRKASANLKQRTLKVDFDESLVDAEQVLSVVRGFGYHPALKEAPGSGAEPAA